MLLVMLSMEIHATVEFLKYIDLAVLADVEFWKGRELGRENVTACQLPAEN